MKELTYEDWLKNPTPRLMWVWNRDIEDRLQVKVICIIKPDMCIFPVLSVTDDNLTYETYQHCAEIKKGRRMTNIELSRWLRESPTREYKYINDSYIFSYNEYKEGCENEEVSEKIRIREDYGEWQEPLVEETE